MTLKFIDSLIFYSENLHKTVEFYIELGLPLESEDHEEVPVHYACELGVVHIAFYEATKAISAEYKPVPRGCAGALQLGFRVDSVDDTFAVAVKLGAKVLVEPQTVPWGKRAVFEDPDGHAVEINQRA